MAARVCFSYAEENKVSSHGNLAPDFSEVKEGKVKILTSIFEGKVQVLKFAGVGISMTVLWIWDRVSISFI